MALFNKTNNMKTWKRIATGLAVALFLTACSVTTETSSTTTTEAVPATEVVSGSDVFEMCSDDLVNFFGGLDLVLTDTEIEEAVAFCNDPDTVLVYEAGYRFVIQDGEWGYLSPEGEFASNLTEEG